MKLIIRQYLSSLRERGELDAIVPDLLSQLGLTVFSRPARGTRQDGVDVAAVGKYEGDERVYLFTIKPGDLTRRDWDGDALQALRPSLNEILDAYIPNRIPAEHRNKPIVVCICLGGDVQEQVRPQLEGFIKRHTTDTLSFQEWNGDKLAALIQSSFLREDLLPQEARSRLRKSLALLDEPTISYRHFSALIKSLAIAGASSSSAKLMAIRQMSVCLWILFAWCRDAGNTEAAYLSAELTLLQAWTIVRAYTRKRTKVAKAIQAAFLGIYTAYQEVCNEFLETNVFPHVGKLHALSSAVHSSHSLDVNLRMFDVLGRIGMAGLWAYWEAMRITEDQGELKGEILGKARDCSAFAKMMISSNPVLFLPAKDDQAIDISIVLSLLAMDASGNDIIGWLGEMLNRASFAYGMHGYYPSTLKVYSDLLAHPKQGDEEYRKEVTSGSILYPLIAVWAALCKDEELYERVAALKREHLEHCNFQIWYPDEVSEEHLFANSGLHGATLSDICVDRSSEDLLAQVFAECEKSPQFKELSAVKIGWWPLVIVACRHHRLPLPIHLWEGLYKRTNLNSPAAPAEEK